jgi:hypothetical protein
MRYPAWLLIQEPLNEELEFLLKDLGVFARLDLTERPAVGLEMRDGEAILASPDPDAFFDLVFENKLVDAFATAPLGQLRDLHKRLFFHRARFIQVEHREHELGGASEPHARRLLRITYAESALQGDFDTQRTRVERRPAREVPFPLLVNPLAFEIEDRHLSRLFGAHALALRGINGFFLPPSRPVDPESYFSDGRIELREAIQSYSSLQRHRPDEPTAISLWRLTNDPAVRDILIEGGWLDFIGEEARPTRARLHVMGLDSADPIQAYRARTIFHPEQAPGASWARAAASALARDLTELLPLGVDVLPAHGKPVSTTVSTTRSYEPSNLEQGSWQRLELLKDELVEKRHRQSFDENVLWPSRSRGSAPPDHDLAERLFLANYWRVPWTANTDRGPWRYALLDLLRWELGGIDHAPRERVQSWSDEGWPWIEEAVSDKMLVVVHRPLPLMSEEDLQIWRLLLPVGAVLKPGGTIRLDDVSSRLDRGFALA